MPAVIFTVATGLSLTVVFRQARENAVPSRGSGESTSLYVIRKRKEQSLISTSTRSTTRCHGYLRAQLSAQSGEGIRNRSGTPQALKARAPKDATSEEENGVDGAKAYP